MRETDAVCYEMKFIHKNLAWTKGTLPKGRKRMDVVDIMNFVKKKNRLEGGGGVVTESTGRGRLFIHGIIFVFELLAESPLNWGIDRRFIASAFIR